MVEARIVRIEEARREIILMEDEHERGVPSTP
jgi:hypothetical protein